jgi:hypothetical protein
MATKEGIKRYRLKGNERNISDEGHELVKEYRRTHNGQIWNGITHQLLHEKYGDAMRHVPGYGWVLTLKTVYRVHLNSGDHDYTSKREAFRQAGNIAAASGAIVAVTKEEVPART